jgi:large subunit ribosomal protein L15e
MENENKNLQNKSRLIGWRKQNAVVRAENPTNPKRAHALGYKAKQGFVIARARIRKGGRTRPKPAGGRKPSHAGRLRYTPKKSLQQMAEERISRRFPNMAVLNSYFVADDGVSKWYEAILVDPHHPVVMKDHKLKWISKQKSRVFRGLTLAGKKMRALK